MHRRDIILQSLKKKDLKKALIVIINLLVLLIISLILSLYFYRIVITIFPGEEALSTLAEFFKRSFGDNNSGEAETLVWSLARYVGYKLGGLSLSAYSTMLSCCYFFILFFSGFLCFSNDCSHKIKWNWWLVPLFIYLLVLINPNLDNFNYVYPFNFHLPSIIYALITVVFVRKWLNNPHILRYFVYIIVCIVSSILLNVDLIYHVLTTIPLVFILIIKTLHDKIKSSQLIIVSLFFLFLLSILKYISLIFGFFSYWYSDEPIRYGDWLTNENIMYGEANFGDVYTIIDRIQNYAKGVLALFNADISNKPILRINTLFYFFRIFIVLVIVFKVLHTLYKFLRMEEDNLYSVYLASGFVMLSLFFILFESGNIVINYRYITAILPWGTIYLCCLIKRERNKIIEKYIDSSLLKRSFNTIIIILFSILCIFDFHIFDSENQYTETDKEYIEVSDYLTDQNLTYGLAPYWLSFPLTIANSGNNILFSSTVNENDTGLKSSYFSVSPTDNYHHEYCNYIVVGDGSNDNLLFDGHGIEWITEQYGAPKEMTKIKNEYVLTYDYNINITPRIYEAQALQWYTYGFSSDRVTIAPSQPLHCQVSDLSIGIWEIRLYGTDIDNISANLESLDILYTKREEDYIAFGFEVVHKKDYKAMLVQEEGISILDKVMIVNISDGIDLFENPICLDSTDKTCTLILDKFNGINDIVAYSTDSKELSLFVDNKLIEPVAVGDDRCVWRVDIDKLNSPEASYITSGKNKTSQIDHIEISSPNAIDSQLTDSVYWVNKDLSSQSKLTRFDKAFSLFPGQFVFGPYITLEPGKYQLIWDAKTFGYSDIQFTIKYDFGSSSLPITDCTILSDTVVVNFELKETIDNLEFICTNNSKNMILINNVKLIAKD